MREWLRDDAKGKKVWAGIMLVQHELKLARAGVPTEAPYKRFVKRTPAGSFVHNVKMQSAIGSLGGSCQRRFQSVAYMDISLERSATRARLRWWRPRGRIRWRR